ncbi:aldo/keto reductase [Paenibacillus sp.]|uniref:aldo/keto reductase n=1 Tax=Paenibacillus sp. TaxID=58172 RepID=UPI002811F9A0|nr:aldo/keto reductase [Paenibacillus sp.]
MKRVRIGDTDLVGSSLALGGVPLGSRLDREASFALMDRYVDAGGNMIDTAEVYANWLPGEASVSEKTIGAWMKARNNREALIVTTKGAHPRIPTMHIARMSPQEIAQDVEASLKRLQVDAIDLYWLHRDDKDRPVGDILETLNAQVRAGNIRYFGCSNWTAERIEEAQRYAAEHGVQGFSANQPMWSFASVDAAKFQDLTLVAMDEEMHRLHRTSGLTAIPYSSQAQGLFAKLQDGRLSLDGEAEGVAPHYRTEDNRRKLERIRTIAENKSLSFTQIALAYLLSQPFPTIPIVGCHTEEQLRDCLTADEVRFTEEELAFLS